MIGRHKDISLFTYTDMYVWHGIRSSTERRLAGHPESSYISSTIQKATHV